jgi:hypothetical protein
MTENFPNLETEINIHLHKSQRTPNNLDIRSSLRHIVINFTKSKSENFRSKKKFTHYIQGTPIIGFISSKPSSQGRVG